MDSIDSPISSGFDQFDYEPIGMPFGTWAHSATISIVPKFPAMLSVLGSICIIREIVEDQRTSQGNVLKRIILGMSITDLFMSIPWVLTTWPSPVTEEIPFSIGNTATCTIQGVFIQFGNLATPMYNGALALCYMFKIRYGWNEIRLKTIEICMHCFILILAVGTSLVSLYLKLFNNNLLVCWIAEYPMGCRESYTLGPGETSDCIRGDNATLYAFFFLNLWIWLSYVVVMFSMGSIYLYVKQTERASVIYKSRASMIRININSNKILKSSETEKLNSTPMGHVFNRPKYDRERAIRSRMTTTRNMARQACWYVGAFFVTEIPDTLVTSLYAIAGFLNFWFALGTYILNPAQGFANFLVFSRSRKEMHFKMSQRLKDIFFLGLKRSRKCGSRCRSIWIEKNLTDQIEHEKKEIKDDLAADVVEMGIFYSEEDETNSPVEKPQTEDNDVSS